MIESCEITDIWVPQDKGKVIFSKRKTTAVFTGSNRQTYKEVCKSGRYARRYLKENRDSTLFIDAVVKLIVPIKYIQVDIIL